MANSRRDFLKGATWIGATAIAAGLLAQAASAAEVREFAVRSAAMEKDVPVTVVFPKGYAGGTSRYPVAYLLHGYGGNHREYLEKTGKVEEAVDRYGFIAVCPDGLVSSWWVDSPVDPKIRYETFVAKELVAWADANLRTVPDRAKRAIAGASMGGYGAMTIGCVHKDVFGAIGSIHGGVELRPFAHNWDIAKRLDPEKRLGRVWDDFSAITKARGVRNGELEILMVIGTADQFFLQGNRKLHELFILNDVAHTYVEIRGKDEVSSAHNFTFQAIGEIEVYRFLDGFFRGRGGRG